jgi:hypothetical protein
VSVDHDADRFAGTSRLGGVRGVGLDDVQGARDLAARSGVHQDGCVVAVEERVGQVEPAHAELDHHRALRQRASRQAPHDLDAEPIVAEEDVADSTDQDAGGLHEPLPPAAPSGSTSSGLKKKR